MALGPPILEPARNRKSQLVHQHACNSLANPFTQPRLASKYEIASDQASIPGSYNPFVYGCLLQRVQPFLPRWKQIPKNISFFLPFSQSSSVVGHFGCCMNSDRSHGCNTASGHHVNLDELSKRDRELRCRQDPQNQRAHKATKA